MCTKARRASASLSESRPSVRPRTLALACRPSRAEHAARQRGRRVAGDGAEQQRQDELGAGQRGGAQREADLRAQPAAVDEHEPLEPLGELVGELHRDPAAERVADDRGPRRCSSSGQQVADAAGVGAERVVAARLAGAPWPSRSGATTVWRSARPVITARQVRELDVMPWMSTIAGPSPRSL